MLYALTCVFVFILSLVIPIYLLTVFCFVKGAKKADRIYGYTKDEIRDRSIRRATKMITPVWGFTLGLLAIYTAYASTL